jgi:hypothetical protein
MSGVGRPLEGITGPNAEDRTLGRGGSPRTSRMGDGPTVSDTSWLRGNCLSGATMHEPQLDVTKQAKPPLDVYPGPASSPTAAVGPGAGLAFVQAYFPLVQHILRIATAYFSIKGYNLARRYLAKSVRLHILVGRQEGEHVYKAVLEEIRLELRQSDMDLYDAVVDLVERMRAGRFRIRDAREMEKPFHCKFYICDDTVVWGGSANFTVNGLLGQAEQVTASHDAKHIRRWTRWYDKVAGDARDLLAEIRDELEQWLGMADPFDVYLKTLLLLFGLSDGSYQQTAHPPVYYQQAIVAWALRQLDSCGGARVVVATGLGKTVIGAEIAARLYATREVERVVLIAPNAVHAPWKGQLEGRRVLAKVFGSRTLFRDRSGIPHHQTYGLDEQLNQAGADTLILIDEAHAYRNQLLARSTKGPVLYC